MFDQLLEFYVRAFAVLLPATATAFAAIHAVRAGLPLITSEGFLHFLAQDRPNSRILGIERPQSYR